MKNIIICNYKGLFKLLKYFKRHRTINVWLCAYKCININCQHIKMGIAIIYK